MSRTALGNKKRFEPTGDEYPVEKWADSAFTIMEAIRFHRIINTDQLVRATGLGLVTVKLQGRKLFDAGYITKPKSQTEKYRNHKNPHHTYTLPDVKPDTQMHFIEHELSITEFVIRMKKACEERGLVYLPIETKTLKPVFSYNGEYVDIGLIPDKVFGIQYPDGTKSWFFLETDTGSMPIRRAGMVRHSSILRKLLQYREVWQQNLHQVYGWKSFRVLFALPPFKRPPSRMQNCISTANTVGSTGLFLFKEGLENIMDWTNGRGEGITL